MVPGKKRPGKVGDRIPCERAHGDATCCYLCVGRENVACCHTCVQISEPILMYISRLDVFPLAGNRCATFGTTKCQRNNPRSEGRYKKGEAKQGTPGLPCARPRSVLCNPSPHARHTPLLARSQSRALLGSTSKRKQKGPEYGGTRVEQTKERGRQTREARWKRAADGFRWPQMPLQDRNGDISQGIRTSTCG